MDNAELINELQTYIREIEDDPVNTLRLMWRAADALEADEKWIAELESNNPIVESVLVDKLYQRIADLETALAGCRARKGEQE